MPESGQTIGSVRRQASGRLTDVSDTPDLDAELLLRGVLGVDRTGLFMRADEAIAQDELEQFKQLLERRLNGEPVAYILRRKAFRNLMLYVDERVLVPRSGTEILVHYALDWIQARPRPLRVIDIGTGSGAIALALAAELGDRTDVEMVASDVSSDALAVAALNRERLGLTGRVRLVRTHLLDGLDGQFDMVLANLPYLRPDQRHPSILSEPQVALYAGEDGFDLYRALIPALPDVLARGGVFIAEIDPVQAETARSRIKAAAPYAVGFLKDLADNIRFVVAADSPEGEHRKTGA